MKLLCLALSVVITVVPANLAISQTGNASSQTSGTPKNPVPAQVAKDCADKIMAKVTESKMKLKIVGSFSEWTFSSPLARAVHKGKVAVIGAPSASSGFLGSWKGYVGCKYDILDKVIVFKEVVWPAGFPQRLERLPGDPQ